MKQPARMLSSNRLESPRFNGRSAASLMLDQSFIAGLGNYLRSEILHQAGVHPKTRPKDLDLENITKWGSLTKSISIRSYESNGLTVSDELAGKRKEMGERRRSYRHSAFCRNGKDCHVCGATIIRIRSQADAWTCVQSARWSPERTFLLASITAWAQEILPLILRVA